MGSISTVGLDDHHAVIEAMVQWTRPVILIALAAVLAFISLTHSVFWGSMAYTLIGGTAVGTCCSYPSICDMVPRRRSATGQAPMPVWE
ncbi:hypothetical protein TSH64_19120 [Azospirillum sp. TSH64]|nr:hypothetical protein TSH64_19120 [Azospirillum sp. TSH64]